MNLAHGIFGGARRIRRLGAALMLPLWLALSGCAVNPATGGIDLMLVSPEEEKEIGRETHAQVLAEFGGVYYDPVLAALVRRVGERLADTVELQNYDYSFTILDTPSVNAFALPGGYIYVTRGLLALIGSEEELAGVLGHELAHVNARHGARSLSRVKARNRYCEIMLCESELPVLSDLALVGAWLAFDGFTHAQEFEADAIGMRYLNRAGYGTAAMVSFLQKLKAHGDLETRIASETGKSGALRYDSTHPLTAERIDRAVVLSDGYEDDAPAGDPAEYLAAIDGMLYGNSREYGFVIGRRYAHPIRQITFRVPEGYDLYANSRQVTAVGPDGALIVFEPSRLLFRGAMRDYLATVWAAGVQLEDLRDIEINGMKAATGWLRRETERGVMDFRLVALRLGSGVIYRVLFISPARMTPLLAPGMRQATYSLRRLSESEAAALKPQRIRVVTVAPGEDIASLAARTNFADFRVDRLAVLNGLAAGETVAPGRLIKLVRE
jgi:predicted Zn-dependent protease